MSWIADVWHRVSKKTVSVTHPMFSVWTDKILSHVDFKTRYGYGMVSFQARKETKTDKIYLIIEHRSPEGTIWIPLDADKVADIQDFLAANFEVTPSRISNEKQIADPL